MKCIEMIVHRTRNNFKSDIKLKTKVQSALLM